MHTKVNYSKSYRNSGNRNPSPSNGSRDKCPLLKNKDSFENKSRYFI